MPFSSSASAEFTIRWRSSDLFPSNWDETISTANFAPHLQNYNFQRAWAHDITHQMGGNFSHSDTCFKSKWNYIYIDTVQISKNILLAGTGLNYLELIYGFTLFVGSLEAKFASLALVPSRPADVDVSDANVCCAFSNMLCKYLPCASILNCKRLWTYINIYKR